MPPPISVEARRAVIWDRTSVLKEGNQAWSVEGRPDPGGGCLAAVRCVCTRYPYRHRQGRIGCGAAGRDGRRVQPRPHRKGAHGRHRRLGAVSRHQSESWHVLTDLQATAINAATGLQYAPRANFAYRAVATANPNYANPNNWRASAWYVTGSHALKVGYQGAYIRVNSWFLVPESQLSYRFSQGVPNQFMFRLPEWHQADRTSTAALYIQDSWTRRRLTLQGALRYDRAWSFSPAEHNGTELTSAFNAAPITFPRTAGVDAFNDITTRFGVAYDVFGNGRRR